jgi:DNA-binding transcriptional LysR family regulator
MNDRMLALRLFVRLARTGSFSAVGRELGLSQPSVSRIIAELEQDIGAALLTRTTRAVTLTEAGVDYLARIDPILVALEEADHAARGTGELRGVLRVATSTPLAVREVVPRLERFVHPHPALRIDLLLDDRHVDLVSEAVDVALRIGTLSNSAAFARKLGVSFRLLAASPAYLARVGWPKAPADLATLAVITGPVGRASEAWTFRKDGKESTIRVAGRVSTTSNESATAAAVAGLGIVSTGHIGCRAELASGALVRVLPDWEMGSADVNAILPSGRAAKPSARAFMKFLEAEFRDLSSWPTPPAGRRGHSRRT